MTTTTTLNCASPIPYDYGNPDDQVALIGDGGYGDVIVHLGNFDIPPTVVTVTTTKTTPVVTVTKTVVVTPTASADCEFWDSGFFFQFEIYNIQNWASDQGSELHQQEKGCGALTGWSWTDATSTSLAKVYFNLPFFIKAGYVERVIVSAGGPKISCHGGGIGFNSRRHQGSLDSRALRGSDEESKRIEDKALAAAALRVSAEEGNEESSQKMLKREPLTERPSRLSLTATQTYTYPSTSIAHNYTAMSWDSNETVILTWTLTDTDVGLSTFTYTSTIPGYTYISNVTTSDNPTASSTSAST